MHDNISSAVYLATSNIPSVAAPSHDLPTLLAKREEFPLTIWDLKPSTALQSSETSSYFSLLVRLSIS